MIPKIIHFCWLSKDPYPLKIQHCLNSWRKHLPDYEIILWDSERFDISRSVWVKQAFDHRKYAFAADYIRFHALYHYGGIYLDADVEVLKRFDDLLHLPYFLGAEFAGTIEAAVIGAEKNCDWVKECLDYYEGRRFVKEDGSIDIRKLPEIMEEVIKRKRMVVKMSYNQTDDISREGMLKDLYLFPNYYFSPKIFDSRRVTLHPETYTIHHYQNSWFSGKAWAYYRFRAYLIRMMGYDVVRRVEKLILKR